MTASDYQRRLLPQCRASFPGHEVINEWAAFSGMMHQYSPRVDIARQNLSDIFLGETEEVNILKYPDILKRLNEINNLPDEEKNLSF